MSDDSDVVAISNNAPQLRNIAADKSKSGRKHHIHIYSLPWTTIIRS